MYIYHVLCFMVLLTMTSAEMLISDPFSDAFIDLINSKQSSWKAGRNFPEYMTLDAVKKLMGLLRNTHTMNLTRVEHNNDLKADLPENFDSREKWPNCPSLNEIRDQGSCGSCWAFGAVEAMTDRYCIYSNGTKHFHFSAQDLVSCSSAGGCQGAWELRTGWEYWRDHGLVSGGNYNSSQGCRPYEIPPCIHSLRHNNGLPPHCSSRYVKTPECRETCENNYPNTYTADKKYAKQIYQVEGEDNIKAEVFKNGPVEVGIIVYSDFLTYKSGVYKHTHGELLGGHALKIIGWGVENGDEYWLIANSWNTYWGDNGFIKMVRREVDGIVVAGEPRY